MVRKNIYEVISKNEIVLFTKRGGEISAYSKNLLTKYGVKFHTHELIEDDFDIRELEIISGWHLLPQLFVNGEFIGGSLVFPEFIESGELNRILKTKFKFTKNGKLNNNAIWRIYNSNGAIVSSSANGEITIHDNNLQSSEILFKGERWVNSVKCSPKLDIIGACFTDATIKIWKDKQLAYVVNNHNRWVNEIEFIDNYNIIVSVDAEGYLVFWDINNSKLLRKIKAHSGSIWSLTKCSPKNIIITAGFDKTIKIWDSKNYSLLHSFIAHENCITVLQYIVNTNLFVSASYDSTIKIWDLVGNFINKYESHESRIWSVSVSHSKLYIASCSADNSLIVWDFNAGNIVSKHNFFSMPLWCSFAKDDSCIYVSLFNGEIKRILIINE